MLETVNSSVQTIASGQVAQLGSVKILTGNTVSAGSTSFRLNRSGFFPVKVTGSIGGLTNTAVRVALVNNTTNVAEQGGLVDIAGLTAGGTQTIPFSIDTLVQVPSGCGCVQNMKLMSIYNLSAEPITISNLNVVVTKVS